MEEGEFLIILEGWLDCFGHINVVNVFWEPNSVSQWWYFVSIALARLSSLLLSTSTEFLLGFPNYCIPHSTEQMLTDRQTDTQIG